MDVLRMIPKDPSGSPIYIGNFEGYQEFVHATEEQLAAIQKAHLSCYENSQVDRIKKVRTLTGLTLTLVRNAVKLMEGGYTLDRTNLLTVFVPSAKKKWVDTIHIKFHLGGYVILGVEDFFSPDMTTVQKLDVLFFALQQDEQPWRESVKGGGLELLFSQGAEHSMCAEDIVEFHHTNPLMDGVVEVTRYICSLGGWTDAAGVPLNIK